ncbi:MAG: polymer-forming cytoskeletal protein [Thiomargarita sp.]|nr:polymer-forming cytoskeletal protein [Thiomargarita sp.]
MFNNRKKITQIDSLIGQQTNIKGEIKFTGGLHIDGNIVGNVISEVSDSDAVLTLSEQGSIHGDVRVPNIILNGKVLGNIYSQEHIELAVKARVTGNVYYNVIEMATGAEVNGSLIHAVDMSCQPALPIEHKPNKKQETSSVNTTE